MFRTNAEMMGGNRGGRALGWRVGDCGRERRENGTGKEGGRVCRGLGGGGTRVEAGTDEDALLGERCFLPRLSCSLGLLKEAGTGVMLGDEGSIARCRVFVCAGGDGGLGSS